MVFGYQGQTPSGPPEMAYYSSKFWMGESLASISLHGAALGPLDRRSFPFLETLTDA